jgi:hypothetical protein
MDRSEITSFNARSKASLYLLRTKGSSGFKWAPSGNFFSQIINFYEPIHIVLVSPDQHKEAPNINRSLQSGNPVNLIPKNYLVWSFGYAFFSLAREKSGVLYFGMEL